MNYEIRDRVNTIIDNDTNLQAGGSAIFQTVTTYPALLEDTKLPIVIALPRQGTPYELDGNELYRTSVIWNLHVYLTAAGEKLGTINDIEALTFPDLFASAFLSRPHLDYNDSGLTNVSGRLTFQISSDLGRLIEYPIGIPGAPRYWGFIINLTIPYLQQIELAI